MQNVRYFAAPDDHGVFVTESKLTKLHNQPPKPGKTISDEQESQTFSMNYHTLEDSLETETPVEEEEALEAAVQVDHATDHDLRFMERSRSKSPATSRTTTTSDHKPRPLRRSLSMQHRASKVLESNSSAVDFYKWSRLMDRAPAAAAAVRPRRPPTDLHRVVPAVSLLRLQLVRNKRGRANGKPSVQFNPINSK